MYRCTECGSKFLRPKRIIIKDEETHVCPICRSEEIEQEEEE